MNTPATTAPELPATKPKPTASSAIAVMAQRLSIEPGKLWSTLKATILKNASDEEAIVFTVVANEYQLNPFLKEIHAFSGKGGIVPIVGVDGWIKIANRQPEFDGIEYEWQHDETGALVSCTAIVYRKDRSKPVRVTEFLSECRRPTDPWKMEHRMLRNKATIQAFRVAFGISGIYDEDEGRDIVEVHAVPIATPQFPDRKEIGGGTLFPEPKQIQADAKTEGGGE